MQRTGRRQIQLSVQWDRFASWATAFLPRGLQRSLPAETLLSGCSLMGSAEFLLLQVRGVPWWLCKSACQASGCFRVLQGAPGCTRDSCKVGTWWVATINTFLSWRWLNSHGSSEHQAFISISICFIIDYPGPQATFKMFMWHMAKRGRRLQGSWVRAELRIQ